MAKNDTSKAVVNGGVIIAVLLLLPKALSAFRGALGGGGSSSRPAIPGAMQGKPSQSALPPTAGPKPSGGGSGAAAPKPSGGGVQTGRSVPNSLIYALAGKAPAPTNQNFGANLIPYDFQSLMDSLGTAPETTVDYGAIPYDYQSLIDSLGAAPDPSTVDFSNNYIDGGTSVDHSFDFTTTDPSTFDSGSYYGSGFSDFSSVDYGGGGGFVDYGGGGGGDLSGYSYDTGGNDYAAADYATLYE